jgi:hypothetical protein
MVTRPQHQFLPNTREKGRYCCDQTAPNISPSSRLRLTEFRYDSDGQYLEQNKRAIRYATDEDLVDVALIEKGFKVHGPDTRHQTPLDFVSSAGRNCMAAHLLEQ